MQVVLFGRSSLESAESETIKLYFNSESLVHHTIREAVIFSGGSKYFSLINCISWGLVCSQDLKHSSSDILIVSIASSLAFLCCSNKSDLGTEFDFCKRNVSLIVVTSEKRQIYLHLLPIIVPSENESENHQEERHTRPFPSTRSVEHAECLADHFYVLWPCCQFI